MTSVVRSRRVAFMSAGCPAPSRKPHRKLEDLMLRRNLRPASRRLRKDAGQGMTEYIIIVALIAIAAIGVVTVFGEDVRSLFGASTNALAGSTNVTNNAKNANNTTYTGKKG